MRGSRSIGRNTQARTPCHPQLLASISTASFRMLHCKGTNKDTLPLSIMLVFILQMTAINHPFYLENALNRWWGMFFLREFSKKFGGKRATHQR